MNFDIFLIYVNWVGASITLEFIKLDYFDDFFEYSQQVLKEFFILTPLEYILQALRL
jgi:hypothetical protein